MQSTDQNNQDQQQKDIADISAQANSAITEIAALKGQLMSNLSDVEVTYDPQTRQDLSKAINQIFGRETQSKTTPTEKAITMEMYLYCVDVIRAAGKYQAESVIAK